MCLCFALLFIPLISAQAAAPKGSVKGLVKYVPNSKKPWRYSRYYVADARKGWLAECVVALKGVPSVGKDSSRKAVTHVMDQKNYQFIPETMAIRAGDRVKFTNSDDALHNVMTSSELASFNINVGKGREYFHRFPKAGNIIKPARLGCVYHGAMRAWIYVFDHEHFVVTGKNGRFDFTNVPPGKYELIAVHPAGRFRSSQSIEIGNRPSGDLVIELSPKSDNKN